MWGFPPTPTSNSPTPTRCPTIQLNSDSTYLKMASGPTSQGAQSHKTAPGPLHITVASPGRPPCFRPMGYRLQVPSTCSLGVVLFSLLEQLTELRGTFYLLVYYQRRELRTATGRDAQGKVGGMGVELPCSLLRHPSPSTSLGSPTEKLWEPCPNGFLWRPRYVGQIDYIIGQR